jgi:probable F420-dependent oxidoreductase
MKVDGGLMGGMHAVPKRAQKLESLGYDAAVTAEVNSDPFFPLLLAAEHTKRIELMTSITVAFARSPMNLAQIAHDLNLYSEGRLILGLGSQIKPHITRRFSMPWSRPAARMREFILAMRAVWDCWNDDKPLQFEGEFYSHTLMTPMFTAPKNPAGAPRVYLAAVGPKMTEVAAEVGDGVIAHAFTTEKYMREITLPALDRGLAKGGRSRDQFEITCPVFVVTGRNQEAMAASKTAVTRQIAFYASTPAYRPVLELHGWGALGQELTVMSKRGQWVEMGERITDDILDAFAVVAEPTEVGAAVKARYGDIIDRLLHTFDIGDADVERAQIEALQSGA